MSPDREMAELLRQMILLSEVSAGSLVPLHSAGKPEAKPPKGVGQTRDRRNPDLPDKNWSLYEHYSYRYEQAQTEQHKRIVCAQARADLRIRQRGVDKWRVERYKRFADADPAEVDAREDEDRRLLLEYGDGVHSAELAADMGWHRSWIETQRERNGREPTYGRPRPSWHALKPDERRFQALTMAQEGMSLRRAARELGIAHTTLSRYWPKTREDGTYFFEEAA